MQICQVQLGQAQFEACAELLAGLNGMVYNVSSNREQMANGKQKTSNLSC